MLEFKEQNKVREIKNAFNWLISRLGHRISKLEDMSTETSKIENEKRKMNEKKKCSRPSKSCRTITEGRTHR